MLSFFPPVANPFREPVQSYACRITSYVMEGRKQLKFVAVFVFFSSETVRARINEELAKSNFVFFFFFHEKYTKNSTLVLIKERRSAF